MPTAAEKAATAKYKAAHIKQIKFTLNDRTDQDILQHLLSISNVQGYLKDLLREKINQEK